MEAGGYTDVRFAEGACKALDHTARKPQHSTAQRWCASFEFTPAAMRCATQDSNEGNEIGSILTIVKLQSARTHSCGAFRPAIQNEETGEAGSVANAAKLCPSKSWS